MASSPDLPAAGGGITRTADGFVVDAALAAPHLGLTPEVFWQEMKRGIVYSTVERGEAEDAGRTRLTLRYRARSWSIVIEDDDIKHQD